MKKTALAILPILVLAVFIFSFFTSPAAAADIFKQISGGFKAMANPAYAGPGGSVTVSPYTFANSLIAIINVLLTFVGVVFFLLLAYSGYLWMTAHGNEEQVKKAKEMMKEIVIGLIVIIVARLFTEFLLTQVGKIIEANK